MKKITLILTAVFGLFLAGCIRDTLPTEYVLQSQISASESAIDGMVNSLYTTLVGYSNADGGIETCAYGSLVAMMEHGTTPLAISGSGGWNTCAHWAYGNTQGTNRGKYPSYLYYGYIKVANDIIKSVNANDMSDSEKAYLGIAYAYRALFYMELTTIMEYRTPTDSRYSYTAPENSIANLGVPIITETTASEDASNNPRATVDADFDLVFSDLAKAETYLTGFTRTDKVQPNLAVVYGLYARAYSYVASRTEVSATYKDASSYWSKAADYAKKAIAQSGCTPLTEAQWIDPINGFNNRDSQNSWMLATSISESNTIAATDGSFSHPMLFGTETDFIIYGWCVGRSLDRAFYERLSDNDFRKNSWLAPNFFYESKNQVAGGPYLIEKDANGNFINNKWAADGKNDSDSQDDWSNSYSGWGPSSIAYKYDKGPSWIRSRIRPGNGYVSWPWLYVNLKFRPHNGECMDFNTGGATDFPMMRVEEMYFIEAEAEAHASGVGVAKNTLETIIRTRNSTYSCTASSLKDFMEELLFQKSIEFWGEGRNYFDAKRLELGRHSAYEGTNMSRYQYCYDINGIVPGLTPQWSDAERNGNQALYHYNNPYTAYGNLYFYKNNNTIKAAYGKTIDLNSHTFFSLDDIK